MARIMYEIILCLEYLHKNHIAHRAINANNIYLLRGDHIKLTNFTRSKQFYRNDGLSKTRMPNHKILNNEMLEKSFIDPFE
jgi:serine/threonine protein kinase